MDTRLGKIVEMFEPCDIVCDVGADHGKLIVEIIKKGLANRGFAMDIAEKPLLSAKNNIIKNNLSDKIEPILSDGLKALKIRPDAVIIAGMGGELISEILENSPFSAELDILYYLVPMTKPERLREYLYRNAYEILAEECVFAKSRPYSVMRVKRFENSISSEKFRFKELYLGKIQPEKDVFCREYLLKLKKQVSAKNEFSKNSEFSEVLACIEEYLEIHKREFCK